jgi:hypothetical protein
MDGTRAVGEATVVVEGGTGPGDLNGDGVVNIEDLVLVTGHFGQTSNDPAWDPQANANGDGLVNITDLMIVTTNFGRVY